MLTVVFLFSQSAPGHSVLTPSFVNVILIVNSIFVVAKLLRAQFSVHQLNKCLFVNKFEKLLYFRVCAQFLATFFFFFFFLFFLFFFPFLTLFLLVFLYFSFLVIINARKTKLNIILIMERIEKNWRRDH